MKVRELLLELNRVDPDLEILCYSEDSDLLPPGYLFRLLDIGGVQVIDAEKRRGDDSIPSFKIGKSAYSKPHVVLEVTSDF